jgi:hypothetical protein
MSSWHRAYFKQREFTFNLKDTDNMAAETVVEKIIIKRNLAK